jgi:hypothetical protein
LETILTRAYSPVDDYEIRIHVFFQNGIRNGKTASSLDGKRQNTSRSQKKVN